MAYRGSEQRFRPTGIWCCSSYGTERQPSASFSCFLVLYSRIHILTKLNFTPRTLQLLGSSVRESISCLPSIDADRISVHNASRRAHQGGCSSDGTDMESVSPGVGRRLDYPAMVSLR